MLKSVEDIVQELEERFPNHRYLYRGQPKIYKPRSSVPSTLARMLGQGPRDELLGLEEKVLRCAIPFCSPHTRYIEIMADLRHFGGMTNFIDFTSNLRVALFFACLGSSRRRGKLFFLQIDRGKSSSDLSPHNFPLLGSLQLDDMEIFRDFYTASNARRAISQGSVLVRSLSGDIDFKEDEETHLIPGNRKQDILNYLAEQEPSITSYSLFADMANLAALGRQSKPKSLAAFKKELADLQDYHDKRLEQGDSKYNEGRKCFFLGNYEEAAECFLDVQKRRNPLDVEFLRFLSSALLHTKRYRGTLATLAKIPEEEWADEERYMAARSNQELGKFSRALYDIEMAINSNRLRSTYHLTNIEIAEQAKRKDAIHSARERYEDLFHNMQGKSGPLGPGVL